MKKSIDCSFIFLPKVAVIIFILIGLCSCGVTKPLNTSVVAFPYSHSVSMRLVSENDSIERDTLVRFSFSTSQKFSILWETESQKLWVSADELIQVSIMDGSKIVQVDVYSSDFINSKSYFNGK